MKRFKNLWDTFCSASTFAAATYDGTNGKRKNRTIRKLLCAELATDAEGGKGGKKEYGKELSPAKVDAYAEDISGRVRSGAWHPSAPTRSIRKMDNGKIRKIAKAVFDDHIVHWALINTIRPAIMRGMYPYCCGSVPGRGLKLIRLSVEKWVRDPELKYFVKLDIRKFYDHINIDLLMKQLETIIADKRILQVIQDICTTSGPGMAVGYYTSPWFANFHLQELDHYIMQGLYKTRRGTRVSFVKRYIRYMDDMLMMGTSKRDLEKAVRAIIKYLHDTLGLDVKECWEIKEIGEMVVDENGKRKCREGAYPVDMGGYTFYRMRAAA